MNALIRPALAPSSYYFKSCLKKPFSFRQIVRNLFIQTETTPNENALKFIPGTFVAKDQVHEYLNKKQALKSPLATALFDIEGVSSVFFGPDFISINKTPDTQWKHIRPLVYAILMDWFTLDKPVFGQSVQTDETISSQEEDSEVVQMIKELLETRIRPAIQSDGGDIEYRGFDEGYVKLKLKGACRSCSSSIVTLRKGIETMMMHYIPEVKGVEQIMDEEEEISMQEFNRLENKLNSKK